MQTNSFSDYCVKVGGVCITAAAIAIAVISAAVIVWVSLI